MFLKLSTKYGMIIVNSDDISYVENRIDDFDSGSVDEFNLICVFKNGNSRFFCYETKEIMNQEFDWIMSKLDVVQDVPETICDNVSQRAESEVIYTWDCESTATSDYILIQIFNMVENIDGKNIVILVSESEYKYISITRYRHNTDKVIKEEAIDQCKRIYDKMLTFRIKE